MKKFFSFIAKTGTSVQALTNGDTTSINTSSSSSVGSVTGTAEESHDCYVFISNKLASDITLTIGQAFDLAYRRYMTDSGKQFEISKLQSHNKILEGTVQTYRYVISVNNFFKYLYKSPVPTGIVCVNSLRLYQSQTWISFCCDSEFAISAKCKFQKLL